MKPEPWRPLCSEDLIQSANEAIDAILYDLEAIQPSDGSLLRGAAGLSLLYAYAAEARSDEGLQEKAARSVERAFLLLENLPAPSLYYGFPGVGFVLHLLRQRFEVPEETLRELDQLLLERLSPWEGDFDLLEGLVGLGVYAVERLPAPSASSCLSLVLSHLESHATQTPAGLGWRTKPPFAGPRYPEGCFNLGMAHGTPGVIALLAALIQRRFEPERGARLLRGAVLWLLAQEKERGFPQVASDNNALPAKPLWAYGDPGVSISLLQAARALSEPSWEEAALRIAKRATLADPREVKSAGLCQGTAGTAHIFLRLYQHTDRPAFYEAAQAWLAETLKRRTPNQGVGGFHSLVNPKLHDLDEVGFLTGAAGIALALLSAISPIDPSWDSALLLS